MGFVNIPPDPVDTTGITQLTGDVTTPADSSGSAVATIANLAVTSGKLASGIDATKIADGSVSNTEFQYLDTVSSNIQTQLNTKAKSVNVQVFEASDTWTKPANAVFVEVWCIGSGGGGASGTKQASGTQTSGGGSGGGAGISFARMAASLLGDTVTVTVAAGGTGGAVVTTDSTNANAGTNGGTSSFGVYVRAGGANGAATYSTGAGPAGGVGNAALATFGGTAGRAGTVGNQGSSAIAASGKGCLGGGAGGGISTTPAAFVGGGCSNTTDYDTNFTTINDTPVGSTASNGQTSGFGKGQPGGGGSSSITTHATSAGTTGKYGSGGSGGGSSLNGADKNSGAGANGAVGVCVVITWF